MLIGFRGHRPLMYAFIGLFIVTTWSLIANDVIGLWIAKFHGPMTFWNPVKLLANVSAVAMIYGSMGTLDKSCQGRERCRDCRQFL